MNLAIDSIRLTHVRIPLVEPFRISSGSVAEKDSILVELKAGGMVGVGEASPMAGTFYSSDTPESCWQELCDQLAPSLLNAAFDSHDAAVSHVNAFPGSNFAKTGIETALWDLEAKRLERPICELLGGAIQPVESGLAVGLYDKPADMLRAIERYMPEGYKRVKIKIERGRDIELVRAVRSAFGNIPLFIDANGAYDESDIPIFQELDQFGLMMFEQPLAGPMLESLAILQDKVRTPVCLDESLESKDDLQRAIALGSLKIANIKIQRVGGFSKALAIYEKCRQSNIDVWVGTMPELGLGGVQGVALATLGCEYPTDVESSTRWFLDDIIQPPLVVKNGMLQPSAAPGIGVEIDQRKIAQYAITSWECRKGAVPTCH